MALIKKSTELSIPTTIKMMIYGQAGTGKSTLALSAPRPLLLDFDNGVRRINLTHLEGVDIVQVDNWETIKQVLQDPGALVGYQTIVVDTIGKMIEYIITHKCGTRQPSIRDWGGINQEFTWFTRTLSMLNKHIVFIAHRDTRKEGDTTIFIPALREKNYNAIVTELDLLGYVEMVSERGVQTRTITFDPTNRNDGKNTCNLPAQISIPNIVDRNGNATAPNNFIQTQVIEKYAEMLKRKQEQQQQYNDLVSSLKEDVDSIVDASGANEFVKRIASTKHIGSSKDKARAMLLAKVKELGLVFNSETKSYEDAEQ